MITEMMNQELIEDNKKLKTDYAILKNNFEILIKENEELKQQIEKMKCCGNCYHRFESNSFHCGECKRFNYGINTDKWELIV